MATLELCIDTNILIDFLKNREPGATTCLAHSVPLLTANTRHFSRVQELTVFNSAQWP